MKDEGRGAFRFGGEDAQAHEWHKGAMRLRNAADDANARDGGEQRYYVDSTLQCPLQERVSRFACLQGAASPLSLAYAARLLPLVLAILLVGRPLILQTPQNTVVAAPRGSASRPSFHAHTYI